MLYTRTIFVKHSTVYTGQGVKKNGVVLNILFSMVK